MWRVVAGFFHAAYFQSSSVLHAARISPSFPLITKDSAHLLNKPALSTVHAAYLIKMNMYHAWSKLVVSHIHSQLFEILYNVSLRYSTMCALFI